MQTEVPETPVATNGRVPADVPLTQQQAKWIARIIATLALHTERAARWLVLVWACALFTYAGIATPDLRSAGRLVVASVFTVLVFFPMWWRTMFPKGAK